MSFLLFLFLITYIYRLIYYKQRVRAAIYPLAAVGVTILFGYILSLAEPRMAPTLGTLTGAICMLVGLAVIFVMPRKAEAEPEVDQVD